MSVFNIENLTKSRVQARMQLGIKSERQLGRELDITSSKAVNSANKNSEAALYEVMFKMCVHYGLNPKWFNDNDEPFLLSDLSDSSEKLKLMEKDQENCLQRVKELEERLALVNEMKNMISESMNGKVEAIKEAIKEHQDNAPYEVREGIDPNESLAKRIRMIIK